MHPAKDPRETDMKNEKRTSDYIRQRCLVLGIGIPIPTRKERAYQPPTHYEDEGDNCEISAISNVLRGQGIDPEIAQRDRRMYASATR
jgi:hypothetical protein